LTDDETHSAALGPALSLLRRDWSRLSSRVRTLAHDITTPCARLNLRLHYPALQDARATVAELVYVIRLFIPHFCLPRKEVDDLYAKRGTLADFDYHVELTALNGRALNLFMRAEAAKGRSGEAGELLLYLLTEWLLEAPQIVAKMSLKTSRDMPVHGADGIHVKYVPETQRLIVYSGEAKLYGDVGDAIRSAISSISDALSPTKLDRELALVRRDLDFSGLSADAREALLGYLNPWDERSNHRIDAVTCLLGFDFAGYEGLQGETDAEEIFRGLALEQLSRTSASFARAMADAGMGDRAVELFLLPLPSVAAFRSLFLEGLGQKPG
jgi:hypothetical protein